MVNFARGHQELSQFTLLHPENTVSPGGVIFLNIYYGVFVSRNSKLVWKRIDPYKNYLVQPDEFKKEGTEFIWEIIFSMYPVPKKKIKFLEGLRSPDPVGHFDGFQSFLLETQDNDG